MTAGDAGSAYFVIALCLVPLLGLAIFVLLHLRPLNDGELEALAGKRRERKVGLYFSFTKSEFRPNLEFKHRMASGGQFYNVRESLSDFPSLAAALLKHKKHEWILVGMEKDREVSLMWVNKGVDKTRVSLRLTFEQVARIAKGNGYNSLLVFHNHPNGNPAAYSCRQPSETDLKSAAEWSNVLNRQGMTLVEFVCERGVPYKYWFSVADTFLPVSDFAQNVRNENGVSRGKNFSLHMELIF